uniref:Protein SZT2 n=1 Tax=Rhabditophanes sp. KR3021 TaxID=114890 RepID=A0AC35U0K8_9BILA
MGPESKNRTRNTEIVFSKLSTITETKEHVNIQIEPEHEKFPLLNVSDADVKDNISIQLPFPRLRLSFTPSVSFRLKKNAELTAFIFGNECNNIEEIFRVLKLCCNMEHDDRGRLHVCIDLHGSEDRKEKFYFAILTILQEILDDHQYFHTLDFTGYCSGYEEGKSRVGLTSYISPILSKLRSTNIVQIKSISMEDVFNFCIEYDGKHILQGMPNVKVFGLYIQLESQFIQVNHLASYRFTNILPNQEDSYYIFHMYDDKCSGRCYAHNVALLNHVFALFHELDTYEDGKKVLDTRKLNEEKRVEDVMKLENVHQVDGDSVNLFTDDDDVDSIFTDDIDYDFPNKIMCYGDNYWNDSDNSDDEFGFKKYIFTSIENLSIEKKNHILRERQKQRNQEMSKNSSTSDLNCLVKQKIGKSETDEFSIIKSEAETFPPLNLIEWAPKWNPKDQDIVRKVRSNYIIANDQLTFKIPSSNLLKDYPVGLFLNISDFDEKCDAFYDFFDSMTSNNFDHLVCLRLKLQLFYNIDEVSQMFVAIGKMWKLQQLHLDFNPRCEVSKRINEVQKMILSAHEGLRSLRITNCEVYDVNFGDELAKRYKNLEFICIYFKRNPYFILPTDYFEQFRVLKSVFTECNQDDANWKLPSTTTLLNIKCDKMHKQTKLQGTYKGCFCTTPIPKLPIQLDVTSSKLYFFRTFMAKTQDYIMYRALLSEYDYTYS